MKLIAKNTVYHNNGRAIPGDTFAVPDDLSEADADVLVKRGFADYAEPEADADDQGGGDGSKAGKAPKAGKGQQS